MQENQMIVLKSRPNPQATVDNFELKRAPIAPLQAGQVLVRHHYLSLDPYMRGRMNEGKSYAAAQALGEVMIGGTVGEVVQSENAGYAVGDSVVGMGGWQLYSVVNGDTPGALHKVDVQHVPISAYLGAVGMPGVTAWWGLVRIIEPKAGETVVVSAAAGAVGSALGALAKARGCRVVGIAGGAAKCAYVEKELGFDACVDYKAHRDVDALSRALKAACPNGIDGYFENVGGVVTDAVMRRMNAFGRIAVCGMISRYDGAAVVMADPSLILINRLKVQGFIVSEHMQDWPAALRELAGLYISGKLRPRETIAEGLAAAPRAFLGLLKGENLGKQLVRL